MPDLLQFGPFKLVASAGDLYKGKTRIRLQQHPLTVLLLLLERPGDLVTREEIRSRVWPNGTSSALSDRAEKPRYIETVARRGYRFLAPVQRSNTLETAPQAVKPAEPQALVPGTVVTHYGIERLIGSGANGRVYEALGARLQPGVVA